MHELPEGEMFAHMREVIDADELRKLGARGGLQEGGADAAAPECAEHAACADGGGAGGIVV